MSLARARVATARATARATASTARGGARRATTRVARARRAQDAMGDGSKPLRRAAATTRAPREDDVDGLKVDELKDVLRTMALPVSGRKADLAARVKEALAARGEGEGEDEDEDATATIEAVVEATVEGRAVEEAEATFAEAREEGGVAETVMETRADAAPAETAAPVERRASVVEGWDEARAPTPGTAFWNAMPRATRADAREAEVTKTTSPLRVVHITAELAPIAKVGGLGDVVEGLARAHGKMGHAVTVILPFYSCLPTDKIDGLTHVMDYDVTKGRYQDGETRYFNFRTTAMRGRVNGIDVILLKPHDDERSNIFQGSKIYGGSYDEREAYLYFCRAAREFLIASGENPNIIHCHEWQACGFPMIFWGLRDAYGQDCDGMSNAKIMLTIHNLDSNGEARQEEFCATGVDASMFATVDKALDERTIGHNPERLCLLKGGIVYSNHVTTVSPTYATEILAGGGGFTGKNLVGNKHKFSGILNGIDPESWTPSDDPFIPYGYDSTNVKSQKALCKKYLQRGLGMKEDPDAPLVVCVSRLVPQKGVNLIEQAIRTTRFNGGQFVLLGTGHSDGVFRKMAETEEFGENSDSTRLMLMYSDALSHLLYAAADIVIVPSMFEPCGLTQMIALRYAALPLVRRTGGLADTVFDIDDASIDENERNGFVFDGTGAEDIDVALSRAFNLYKSKRSTFEEYQKRAMNVDNTWTEPAQSYIDLYRTL